MSKRFSVVTEYYDRFRDVGAMEEDGDGDYVLYSDYAALLARAEAAEKERDELRADNKRMREALSIISDNREGLTAADCADIARGVLGGEK
jgi:hypothetical protein